MKNKFLLSRFILIIGLFSLVLLTISCSKDDDQPVPKPIVVPEGYSFLTNVGTYPNITSYLHGVKNLDNDITSEGAMELPYTALMFGYKDFIYLSKFGNPAAITKYSYDAEGTPIEGGKFVDPTSTVMSSVVFVSETEAYAANAGKGSYKIIKFNPSTMEKVGEVDMSMIEKPEAKQIMLQGLLKRGNKLYTGVNYSGESYTIPAIKSTFVAVVDLDKMKVTKLLKDDRSARMLSGRNTLQLDEATGDIYVLVDGYGDLPNGVLRIKSGEEKFDTSYFLNFKEITGKPCKNLMIYGANKALTARAENEDDLWEMNGPNYKYYKLDLQNKTSIGEVEGLPIVYGGLSSLTKVNDNEHLLNAVTGNNSSLYKFNPQSGAVTKKITVEGKISYMYIHKK